MSKNFIRALSFVFITTFIIDTCAPTVAFGADEAMEARRVGMRRAAQDQSRQKVAIFEERVSSCQQCRDIAFDWKLVDANSIYHTEPVCINCISAQHLAQGARLVEIVINRVLDGRNPIDGGVAIAIGNPEVEDE